MPNAWRPSYTVLLVTIGVSVLILALTRGRAIALVAIVIVVFVVGGQIIAAIRNRNDHPERAVKNVTPLEPALPPGSTSAEVPSPDRAPSVVVIEPPDSPERLAEKTRTGGSRQ